MKIERTSPHRCSHDPPVRGTFSQSKARGDAGAVPSRDRQWFRTGNSVPIKLAVTSLHPRISAKSQVTQSCSGSPQMPRKNHTWPKSGSAAFGSVERKHLVHAEGTRYAEPTGLRPFLTGSKPRTRLNPGLWELSAGSESYTIWGHFNRLGQGAYLGSRPEFMFMCACMYFPLYRSIRMM